MHRLPAQLLDVFEAHQATLIKDALDAGDFARLELLTTQICEALSIDHVRAQNSLHLKARSQFCQGKFAEARANLDLVVEIRKQNKSAFGQIDVALAVLNSQLHRQDGNLRRAEGILRTVIRECVAEGLSHLLCEPVIYQCVVLLALRDYRKIYKLLRSSLPSMKNNMGYREELRQLWVAIAADRYKAAEISEIVRLILNEDVEALLQQPQSLESVLTPPVGWTGDAISNFLQLTQNITLESFVQHSEKFNRLSILEARFRISADRAKEIALASSTERVGQSVTLADIETADLVSVYFLMRAQATLLGAIRTAAAGQYAETHMLLRGALECGLYCFYMQQRPELKDVWFNRHADDFSYQTCRDAFSMSKIDTALNQRSVVVGAHCAGLYNKLIDFGAHPNERLFSATTTTSLNPSRLLFSVISVDSRYVPGLLDLTREVGHAVLEVFALALPSCIAAEPSAGDA